MERSMWVWSVHVCALSKECRTAGAIWRLNVTTPRSYFGLALRTDDKFVNSDGTSRWTTWVKHPS